MSFHPGYVLLLAVSALLLVPVVVLCAECLAALLPPRRPRAPSGGAAAGRPRVAVLVPAHNEEADLAATLASVVPQARAGDRVVVVADNCTDATAAVARRCGAAVVERDDPTRAGKGYALEAGVRALAGADGGPPDVVVVVDADTAVHPGALDALSSQVASTGRPAQAVYVLEHDAGRSAGELVSAAAFLVKNLVRPRGLLRMRLPCLLNGSGMAVPWAALLDAPLGGGSIVEDVQLSVDLALRGRGPHLCLAARVSGRLPRRGRAAARQRTRWEHGHLRTFLTQAPRLLAAAVTQRRPELLALALELAVPPVSLLVLLLAAAGGALAVAASHGAPWWPVLAVLAAGSLCGACAAAVWVKFARPVLTLRSLAAIPFYVCRKIPIYVLFLIRPETRWVRTERQALPPALPPVAASPKAV